MEEQQKNINATMREEIAVAAINLVNKFEFGSNNSNYRHNRYQNQRPSSNQNSKPKVTSTSLRNLLQNVNDPNITPNQFNLFIRYQASKASQQDSNLPKFVESYLKEVNSLLSRFKAKSDEFKIKIMQEFLKDIIMGAKFLEKNEDNNKLTVI